MRTLLIAVVLSLLIGGKIGYDLAHGKCAAEKLLVERAHQKAQAEANQKAQEVSRGYQQDLDQIRRDRDRLRKRPVRVVRVCPDPSVSATPSGYRNTPSGTIAPEKTVGFDIGQPLYELVDDGDQREKELRSQLIACQEFHAR